MTGELEIAVEGLIDRIIHLADGQVFKGCAFTGGQLVNRHSINHASVCEDENLGLGACELHGLVQPMLTCETACNNRISVDKEEGGLSSLASLHDCL